MKSIAFVTSCFFFAKAPSRRGDIQILGFCLLHWLCGSLPWENDLKNAIKVMEAKARWVPTNFTHTVLTWKRYN